VGCLSQKYENPFKGLFVDIIFYSKPGEHYSMRFGISRHFKRRTFIMKKIYFLLLMMLTFCILLSVSHVPDAYSGPMLKMVSIEAKAPGQVKNWHAWALTYPRW
jgi:hypothetical protein